MGRDRGEYESANKSTPKAMYEHDGALYLMIVTFLIGLLLLIALAIQNTGSSVTLQ